MESDTKLDRIIIGTSALAISGAILSILLGEKDFNYIDGSPRYEAALGLCYAACGIWSLMHFKQVSAVFRRSKPLVALIIMALLSPFWAENPLLALRRALAVTGGTLVGVLLAARFTSSERLRLLSFILRLLAAGSLILAVFLPRYGISDDLLHPGSWVGVFNHKNGLGAYSALAFLVDWFRPGRFRPKIPWFALYILLLLKSGSASPLAAILVTGILVSGFNRLRVYHKMTLRAIVLCVSVLGFVFVTAGLGSGIVQLLLGRSSDLSGRSDLWKALIPAILLHPILGYGYGAFWAGGSKEYYEVFRQINWVPMYAHNGYMEMFVSLGLLGFTLACLFLLQTAVYSARMTDIRRSREDLFPLALFFYFLIRNATEVTLLYHNSLDWAIFVATALSVLPGSPERIRDERPKQKHIVVEEYG